MHFIDMATYNNKHWLLSHIRNSYIATDDTGMCEAVMLSDDLPSRYIEACKSRRETTTQVAHTSSKSHHHHHHHHPHHHHHHQQQQQRTAIDENYEWYPGLDQSDDEDLDPLSQSYDIQMDQDYGLRSKHSNVTSQKYDKVDASKRRASKVRSIKLEDIVPVLTDTEIDELFVRRLDFNTTMKHTNGHATSTNGENGDANNGDDSAVQSLLAQRLEEVRRQPVNKFQTYARFDGNQMSVPTKTFKIFLTMLPKEQQNYPMECNVVATARIQEFIGLICYKCSITYTDVPLLSVQNYGLYITEGDGEIDDFPPLDLREPCSKFRFSHLALVERKNTDILRQDSRPISETDTTLNNPNQDTIVSQASTNQKDLERMIGHTIQMEAPLYRSYRVKMFIKGIFKTDIQLGVSGEKLEIDPVQPQNSKFFRQKPISHSMESVVFCDIEETARSRAVIRIVYSPSPDTLQQQQQQQLQAQHDLNSSFRHYDFVTNPVVAAEITEKINNIIEVRSSSSRREYLSRHLNSTKKKKLTFSFK